MSSNEEEKKASAKSKYIFITGGVLSSLGKGLVAGSTGCILKELGFSVNIKKMDPYLNVDPGTMNPMQHGEVFVTNDGVESDLDLGNYERFTGIQMNRNNYTTSGTIYKTLIEREREGYYLGKTIQIIPHVTGLIKEFIQKDAEKYDFTIIEVGGTVGDLEGAPFLEALRQLRSQLGRRNVMFLHLSYVPYLGQTDEIKTKPTQHSVQRLMQSGIIADAIMCRTKQKISDKDKQKIAMFCNVDAENVLEAPDVDDVYTLPYIYAKNGLARAILGHFKLLKNNNQLDKTIEKHFKKWGEYGEKFKQAKKEVCVCVAGKYANSNDCYKSLFEAIHHAGYANNVRIKLKWLDSRKINDKNVKEQIKGADCVIVPGGFGVDGVEGKIAVIKYARENNLPLLGICLGMQLSVIEFMRNVVGVKKATSMEFDEKIKEPVVCLMTGWQCVDGKIEKRTKNTPLGGTMRLGGYVSKIEPKTLASKVYDTKEITERHRHRYEINEKYIDIIEKHGGKFSAFAKVSGKNTALRVPEMFEIPSHKFFLTCQFHPELISKPFDCHPLFEELVKVAMRK